jgi:hypothetical protein
MSIAPRALSQQPVHQPVSGSGSLSPLLSVVIPNYNHAPSLGDAIHSVWEKLTHAPESHEFKKLKRIAYANGHYAFGLLAYGKNESKAACRFFLGAVKYQPGSIFDPLVTSLVLKAWISAKLVHWLKRLSGKSK